MSSSPHPTREAAEHDWRWLVERGVCDPEYERPEYATSR